MFAASAMLVLCGAPTPADARKASPRTFQHDRFTLDLPAGWWVADWRRGPPAHRFAPARKPRAAASAPVVHLADGRGNFLSIYINRANDFEADAIWTLRAAKGGDALDIVAETPCARERGPCSGGNGTLEIGTLPAVELRGHRFSFLFGNVRKESGVELDTFRWMLQGFRPR